MMLNRIIISAGAIVIAFILGAAPVSAQKQQFVVITKATQLLDPRTGKDLPNRYVSVLQLGENGPLAVIVCERKESVIAGCTLVDIEKATKEGLVTSSR